jgi:hypothetical protein
LSSSSSLDSSDLVPLNRAVYCRHPRRLPPSTFRLMTHHACVADLGLGFSVLRTEIDRGDV